MKARICIIAGLLLAVSHLALASTVRTFNAPAARVAEAAKKSIEARGLITASSDGGLTLDFASGQTWGRLSITPETDGATVSIISNEVTSAWGKKKGPDNSLMEGISADLAGKEIKADEKQRWKAREMEHERARIAATPYVPAGPANILVRADRETVKSAIITECAAKGFAISGETEHAVTVFKDADAGFNFVGRVLFGNATVRAYRANIQFMLSTEGGDTRVTTAADILAQNGYGAFSRQVVTEDPQAKSILQSVLDGVKARVEQSKELNHLNSQPRMR
jgi:hypothetical protein